LKSRSADYLSIIEAAYASSPSDDEWVQGIADTARPILDQGHGVHVWTYDARDAAAYRLDAFGQAGGDRSLEAGARDFVSTLSQEVAEVLFPPSPPVELMHRVFQRVAPSPRMAKVLDREKIDDAIGVRGHNPDGRGVVLAAITTGLASLPPRVSWALTRVAPHLSAAARLRFEQGPLSRLESAHAIFSQKGRLEHLGPDAGPDGERALPGAVERRLAASSTRDDPERALELWGALIAGRWSIVDHVDRDGKRFILAKKNTPDVPNPAALTPAERLVLLYAAWGHSNTLISYETGFSASTVSTRLRGALRKLRVKSRAELGLLLHGHRPSTR
jgi:DNA-binding CsgD family transcriptional regulator